VQVTSSEQGNSAKDLVYSQLRRAIIMSHYRPGERLNLQVLAQQFDVSVTPVREALQMLEQEGLVSIKPRSGHYVTHMTLKELLDWLELRQILEVGSVERAATRITDEQLCQLEQIHAGYSGDDEESVERYITENRRVHCLIAEASGNSQLAEMLGQVHDRLARLMVVSHAGQIMLKFRHEDLFQALRTRDPAEARRAMLDELANMRQMTIERVIREESASWQVGA
jgi:GntR family transcriptional regulator, rspAB operon transcriptional repressor